MLEELKVPEEPAAVVFQSSGECERRLGGIDDDHRGVISQHADRLRDILVRLDASASVADMDLPGFRLHPLKGEMKGFWAVTVRANW